MAEKIPAPARKKFEEERKHIHNFVKSKEKFKGGESKYEKIKLGVPGFDEMIKSGGIPKATSVLICGGPGTGKTILCLQTLYNKAREGKKCLYMSFEESEDRLVDHMKKFGWDVDPLIKGGKLKIVRLDPFGITRSVRALLEKAKGELMIDIEPVLLPDGYVPDFVVMDSLSSISSAFVGREESYRTYLEQLFKLFEKLGATSFLIAETEQVHLGVLSRMGVEEFLADAIIVMYNVMHSNKRYRGIEILKVRGAQHVGNIVSLDITEKGMIVHPNKQLFTELDMPPGVRAADD
ncbi:MAG: ATPase domain-containing protein [Candidatus Micrarchaeota archaeon]